MPTPHDEHFWNTLANYDEEVTSLFRDAAARPLIDRIQRHIGPDTVVADHGCIPDKLLPFLNDANPEKGTISTRY